MGLAFHLGFLFVINVCALYFCLIFISLDNSKILVELVTALFFSNSVYLFFNRRKIYGDVFFCLNKLQRYFDSLFNFVQNFFNLFNLDNLRFIF